jgi:hypothetical protein
MTPAKVKLLARVAQLTNPPQDSAPKTPGDGKGSLLDIRA